MQPLGLLLQQVQGQQQASGDLPGDHRRLSDHFPDLEPHPEVPRVSKFAEFRRLFCLFSPIFYYKVTLFFDGNLQV